MNVSVLLAVCLATTSALAGDKPSLNSAAYPLTAHVVSSQSESDGNIQVQRLTALIDGREVELLGRSGGVLALGDYRARITGSFTPSKPNAYDLYVGYEFLFPDGHTRPYALVGLGSTGEIRPRPPSQ